MKRADLKEKLLDIRRDKGWTWKHIQEEIGGISPILITDACMRQMKLPKAQATKAAALFGLSAAEERMLNEAPTAARSRPCRRPTR
jgi:cyanate lyase